MKMRKYIQTRCLQTKVNAMDDFPFSIFGALECFSSFYSLFFSFHFLQPRLFSLVSPKKINCQPLSIFAVNFIRWILWLKEQQLLIFFPLANFLLSLASFFLFCVCVFVFFLPSNFHSIWMKLLKKDFSPKRRCCCYRAKILQLFQRYGNQNSYKRVEFFQFSMHLAFCTFYRYIRRRRRRGKICIKWTKNRTEVSFCLICLFVCSCRTSYLLFCRILSNINFYDQSSVYFIGFILHFHHKVNSCNYRTICNWNIITALNRSSFFELNSFKAWTISIIQCTKDCQHFCIHSVVQNHT